MASDWDKDTFREAAMKRLMSIAEQYMSTLKNLPGFNVKNLVKLELTCTVFEAHFLLAKLMEFRGQAGLTKMERIPPPPRETTDSDAQATA